jgi:hypothetical protein
VTEANGLYLAADLLPRRYICFELIGFSKQSGPTSSSRPGATLELNTQLQVGELSESVQVDGVALLVDMRSSLITHTVAEDEFERMPKGRRFESIAARAPWRYGTYPVPDRTDLLLTHEFAMAGTKRLRLEMNVLNVFNQKTSRHIFNNVNKGAGSPRQSSAIDLSGVDLARGYDYNALISASGDGANARDVRFGMDDLFDPGTRGQFTVKFLF